MEYLMRCDSRSLRSRLATKVVAAGAVVLLGLATGAYASPIDPTARPLDLPTAPTQVNGWPTFASEITGPIARPVVMSSSVPVADRMGDDAPATVPLPPAVLSGAFLLGVQWVVLRVWKTRRI